MSRIQHRAICSACGREQAIDASGYIADHGFTIEWGSRNGRCYGSRHHHFGMKEGRDFRADLASSIARQAVGYRNMADKIMAGAEPTRSSNGKVIENPMPWQTEQHASGLRRKAEMYLAEAHRMTVSVEQWQERFPVEVMVEDSKAPAMHARSVKWGFAGKLCSASARAHDKGGRWTEDAGKVTCPRCLKIMAARAAKEAA